MCPFYFLESKTELSLLENESATFLAEIQGNEGTNKWELKYLRHFPYPFRFQEIGRNSLDWDVVWERSLWENPLERWMHWGGIQYYGWRWHLCAICTLENNQIRSMRTDSNDDSNVENNHEVENAYDEMLSQIDRTRSCKETDFHLNIRGMHSTGDNRKQLPNMYIYVIVWRSWTQLVPSFGPCHLDHLCHHVLPTKVIIIFSLYQHS